MIRLIDDVIASQLNLLRAAKTRVLTFVGFDVFSATVYKPAAALTAATTVTPSIVYTANNRRLDFFAASMKFVP